MKQLLSLMMVLIPSLSFALQKSNAQVLCGETEEIFSVISEYKEKMHLVLKEDNEVLVTVWVNKETGTYTIVRTKKDRSVSCVMSAGELFPSS